MAGMAPTDGLLSFVIISVTSWMIQALLLHFILYQGDWLPKVQEQ